MKYLCLHCTVESQFKGGWAPSHTVCQPTAWCSAVAESQIPALSKKSEPQEIMTCSMICPTDNHCPQTVWRGGHLCRGRSVATSCRVANRQVLSWEKICSPGFLSSPRGVKKSQTINPFTLAPACRTGWMHRRDGAACMRKPVRWRSAWGIVPQGPQSLLSSSGAPLAPHSSSKALGSSAHNSRTSARQNF